MQPLLLLDTIEKPSMTALLIGPWLSSDRVNLGSLFSRFLKLPSYSKAFVPRFSLTNIPTPSPGIL